MSNFEDDETLEDKEVLSELTLDDLTVRAGGREIIIDARMLRFQGLDTGDLQLLKELYAEKLLMYAKMEEVEEAEELALYGFELTKLEYQIQAAWEFEENRAFHKFWEAPKCTCPKTDNNDAYPSGYYSYRTDCPVHSQEYLNMMQEFVENFKALE